MQSLQLNNERVSVDDRVYHITKGWGTVTSYLPDGTVMVKLDKMKNKINMTEEGYSSGARVFYWADPVLYIPTKSDQQNSKFKNKVIAVVKLLNTIA